MIALPPTSHSHETPAVVSVIVPTYRRVESLRTCLTALAQQSQPAAEIIVTVRASDEETKAFLQQWLREDTAEPIRSILQIVPAGEGGVVGAMNSGLAAVRSDCAIVALTDDDAAPRPDWLERIRALFVQHPQASGVGGRDLLPWDHQYPYYPEVGRVRWYGKVIGNHHKGIGPLREVELLKGVNCAYRAAALQRVGGFDTRLRGPGAQVHWELSLGFALRAAQCGSLLYDPDLVLDHYPAPRQDADVNHRGGFEAASFRDAVYNETRVLLEHLPPIRRWAFWAWVNLVGTIMNPGLVQWLRLALVRRDPHANERFKAAWHARWEARSSAGVASTAAVAVSSPLPERRG